MKELNKAVAKEIDQLIGLLYDFQDLSGKDMSKALIDVEYYQREHFLKSPKQVVVRKRTFGELEADSMFAEDIANSYLDYEW